MPEFRYIPKDKLEIDPENVRPEPKIDMGLRDSIKKKGILEPLLVRPSDEEFLITIGAMRFKNGGNAGLDKFPCIIVEDLEDEDLEAMSASIHENLYRFDPSPGVWAKVIKDFCMKIGGDPTNDEAIEEISEKTGMSKDQVRKHLGNAEMPEWYLELMKNQKDRNLPQWIKAAAKDPEKRTDSQKEALQDELPEGVDSGEVDRILSRDSLKKIQLSDIDIASDLAESDDYREMIDKSPVEALQVAIEASGASRSNVDTVIERGKKRMEEKEEKKDSGRRSKKRGHKVEFKFRDDLYTMLQDWADHKDYVNANVAAKAIVGNHLNEEARGEARITKVR